MTTALVALAVTLAGPLAGCGRSAATAAHPLMSSSTSRDPSTSPSLSASPSASPTSSASPSPSPSPTPSPAPQAAPPPLNIVDATIPYGADRKAQMAAYSLKRYGVSTWHLKPSAVVLHFTESGDDPWSTIDYFAGNTPNAGSLPGVCAHFIVAKDGTIYSLVPTDVMCRHTVGLNDSAIGIEIIQATSGHSSSWADQQILGRPAQIGAVLALIKRLQGQYGFGNDRVLGHGTANDDPAFHDLTGMRNDHTDFGPEAVAEVRARLAAMP